MSMPKLLTINLLLIVLNELSSASTLAADGINTLTTAENLKSSRNNNEDLKPTKLSLRQFSFTDVMRPPLPPLLPIAPYLSGCPLCDSSVYSYCSYKVTHDACCCDFSGSEIYYNRLQCAFYDCSVLHAKSCYEHSLIKNCCCNNPY